LLVAPSLSGGLPEILENLTAAMNHPFHIQWVDNSPKCVLLFVAAYGMGIGIYLSTKRNYRPREEHGSARWGGAAAVDKKYRDKNPQKNKILTQNVRIGLDGRKHRRNLNVLVVAVPAPARPGFTRNPTSCRPTPLL
jgi:type IV secretion system protein VirD4